MSYRVDKCNITIIVDGKKEINKFLKLFGERDAIPKEQDSIIFSYDFSIEYLMNCYRKLSVIYEYMAKSKDGVLVNFSIQNKQKCLLKKLFDLISKIQSEPIGLSCRNRKKP